MSVARPLTCVKSTTNTLANKKIRVTGAGNVRLYDMLNKNLPEMKAVKRAAQEVMNKTATNKIVSFDNDPYDCNNPDSTPKKKLGKNHMSKRVNATYFTPVSM